MSECFYETALLRLVNSVMGDCNSKSRKPAARVVFIGDQLSKGL